MSDIKKSTAYRGIKKNAVPYATRVMSDTYRSPPEKKRKASPTKTLGTAGTAIYGGYVVHQEKNKDLAEHDSRYRMFAQILANTSIVAAGVRYFLKLISDSKWTFKPAEKDKTEEYSQKAEEILTEDPDTPWPRILSRAAMYVFYGFSVQEWTAMRREDGVMTFKDISPRAQSTIERWDQDRTGTIYGCFQTAPQDEEEIYLPREKIMYIVDDSLNDSPEGWGLFRHLVEPAQRLERYEQLEGFGFETDLRGIPLGRAPLGELEEAVEDESIEFDEAAKMKAIKPIMSFIENHIKNPKLGLLLDSMTYRNDDESASVSGTYMYNVELLTGSATSFAENAAAIERVNREVGRILNVEQMLLGSNTTGSWALSRDKTDAFLMSVESAITEICYAVKNDLLKPIWALNGWDEELMPEIETATIENINPVEVAATLRDMATAGALLMPTDPVIAQMRDLLGVFRPDANLDGSTGGPDSNPVLADSKLQAETEMKDKEMAQRAKEQSSQQGATRNGQKPKNQNSRNGSDSLPKRKTTRATASRNGQRGR